MLSSLKEGVLIGISFWVVGIVLMGGAHLVMRSTATNAFPDIPENAWQAVFLENGQVYFGKLAERGPEYVSLTDVYYLKEASDLQNSNLNLVKLGGELHGPEDTIYIRKDSITFWENMKESSRVVQAIAGSKK